MDGPNEKNAGITLHIPSKMAVPLHGLKPTTGGLSALRELWIDKIVDLISGVLPKVPPCRMINHQINLIDPNKQIHYQLPKCPDTLKEELAEKISCYTSAGW